MISNWWLNLYLKMLFEYFSEHMEIILIGLVYIIKNYTTSPLLSKLSINQAVFVFFVFTTNVIPNLVFFLVIFSACFPKISCGMLMSLIKYCFGDCNTYYIQDAQLIVEWSRILTRRSINSLARWQRYSN